jgi:hypothetical protein
MTANDLLITGLRLKYSGYGNENSTISPALDAIARELIHADDQLDRAKDRDATRDDAAYHFAMASAHQQQAANLISMLALLTR